jgi:hypothetical protein
MGNRFRSIKCLCRIGLALQFAKPVETDGTTLQQMEWRGLDSQKWQLKKISVAGENDHFSSDAHTTSASLRANTWRLAYAGGA